MITSFRVFCAAAVMATLPLGAMAQQRVSPSQEDVNPPTVQEQDLVLGAWELDLSRSSFMPGPPPLSEIRSYQEEHEGIKADILTTNADGTKTHMEYVSSFNELTAMVTGSSRTDAIRLRKVDAYTAEGQLSYQGKASGRTRRVVSPDGRTLTITLDRTAPTVEHNVYVYRRVR